MNNDRELLQQALDVMLAAIKAGDWKVDGACDPDYVLEAIRTRLSQCERCGEANPAEIHTCSPPEQEPIAYLCENAVGHKYFRWKKPPSTYKPIALYTAHASPQRIWQGLLNEEVVDRANAEVFAEAFARGVAWAELKLKEKNNG
jgi:hypothetical protein